MYNDLVKQCRDCVEALCGECKYKHLQKPGNFVRCMNALLGEAADAIEELSEQLENETEYATALNSYVPQWIPVTERLPDYDEDVLVYANGLLRVWDRIKTLDDVDYWEDEYGYWVDFNDVDYWMPLPPSPEPSKEET